MHPGFSSGCKPNCNGITLIKSSGEKKLFDILGICILKIIDSIRNTATNLLSYSTNLVQNPGVPEYISQPTEQL